MELSWKNPHQECLWKDILAGHSREGKTHRTPHCLFLEEPHYGFFSLRALWIWHCSQFKRMMKWNARGNSHCNISNRVRRETAISRQHLGELSGLSCAVPMEQQQNWAINRPDLWTMKQPLVVWEPLGRSLVCSILDFLELCHGTFRALQLWERGYMNCLLTHGKGPW